MTKHTYSGAEPIRLNKWMAELGLCSRREAEGLIEAGGVYVNDEKVSAPGHKILPGQTLTLADRATEVLQAKFTAVLNKPVGYVSAQPEADQIPAARLITRAHSATGVSGPGRDARLAPLGRLDQDSRGLLLLSEDGVLAKALIGPHHGLEKEYLVTVTGNVTAGKLTLLRNGLSLDNRRLKAAKVDVVEGQTLRFVLREGRKRQIRRMCSLVGLEVTDLLRTRIGALELGDLEEGKWRPLTAKERDVLIAMSRPRTPRKGHGDSGPRKPGQTSGKPRFKGLRQGKRKSPRSRES